MKKTKQKSRKQRYTATFTTASTPLRMPSTCAGLPSPVGSCPPKCHFKWSSNDVSQAYQVSCTSNICHAAQIISEVTFNSIDNSFKLLGHPTVTAWLESQIICCEGIATDRKFIGHFRTPDFACPKTANVR